MLTINGADFKEKRLMREVEKAVFSAVKQDNFFITEITVTDEKTIRRLNDEARGVDAVTDVLSFPAFDKLQLPVSKDDFGDYDYEGKRVGLGCIVICRERARSQAEEFGHSYAREIGFLTCHGLLHLLGFDHIESEDEKAMIAMQNRVMDAVGLKRN